MFPLSWCRLQSHGRMVVVVVVVVEYIIILIIIIVVLLDFGQLQFCQTVHLES